MSNKRKKINEETQYKLKINQSQYTKIYKLYMQKQYPMVQAMLKKIVQMPFCRQHYLKYPLDALLKGVCKKMLINVYELIVLGYFLSEVDWKLDSYLYATLADVFPTVIHVNEPTDPEKLKQLSMFLYFSSYSIKQFLNEDMTLYRLQMIKIIPQFQHIQNTWTSSQNTVGQILNPKLLNKFFQEAMRIQNFPDYNFCVDKILQISPCYDITSKTQKGKQMLNFGFMEMNRNNHQQMGNFSMNHGNITDLYFHNPDQNQNDIKIEGIDMSDFKQFDGQI